MQEIPTHSIEEIAIGVKHLENDSYNSVHHIKYHSGYKQPEIGKKIGEGPYLTTICGVIR